MFDPEERNLVISFTNCKKHSDRSDLLSLMMLRLSNEVLNSLVERRSKYRAHINKNLFLRCLFSHFAIDGKDQILLNLALKTS